MYGVGGWLEVALGSWINNIKLLFVLKMIKNNS